ncbi:MAG TPA: cyclic lactone autoinducer peptide [Desulfotomaculum sp.]|nr:cyclic lactone autoinducer peptide [Desulfotomaculum sp.]HBY03861.1 cyclic lactone autoinducer peptide [Desulfotomaculum sp.]
MYLPASISTTVLLFSAAIMSSSACWISHYQPKVPEILRK